MTLVEVITVAAIIGIASSITIVSYSFVMRRERLNSIAFEVAGWLEEARAQSARSVALDDSEGGCAIILTGPVTEAKTGDALAVVEPDGSTGSCGQVRQKSLIIPETQGDRFSVAVYGLGSGKLEGSADNPCKSSMKIRCQSSVALYFTPRGMWDSDSLEPSQSLEIRIVHSDGAGPKRCVRMSPIIGSVDIGQSSDGTISSTCQNWSRI